MKLDSTKKQGGRKPTKGELEQLYVKDFVKALLELASNTNVDNSQQQRVTAIWSNNCELEVSGESKALLELIKRYDTEKELEKKTRECHKNYKNGGGGDGQGREMDFDGYQIDRVRNATYILRELGLLEDKRPKNKEGKLKNPRLLVFSLKLKSKKYEDNYNMLQEKLDKYCNNVQDSGKKLDNKTRYFINNENLAPLKINLLRSLNCRSQKEAFGEHIGTHRLGFFRIQTEIEIRPWFLWILEKNIANFEPAAKIRILIDFRIIKDSFDLFWQEFKQLKIEEELNSENVIKALAKIYTTKSVVISIICREPLPTDILTKLNIFYSQLSDKINSNGNHSKQNCLVVFIMDKFQDSINYLNTTNLKLLKLKQITKSQVYNWLDEIKNDKLYNQIDYEINDDTYTEVEKVGENPESIIHYICQSVFKSDDGIQEFEKHWQHWK